MTYVAFIRVKYQRLVNADFSNQKYLLKAIIPLMEKKKRQFEETKQIISTLLPKELKFF
jgi:hypothetical protein